MGKRETRTPERFSGPDVLTYRPKARRCTVARKYELASRELKSKESTDATKDEELGKSNLQIETMVRKLEEKSREIRALQKRCWRLEQRASEQALDDRLQTLKDKLAAAEDKAKAASKESQKTLRAWRTRQACWLREKAKLLHSIKMLHVAQNTKITTATREK